MAAEYSEQLLWKRADLDDPQIQALLALHTERALANARCRVGHALDLSALKANAIEVWGISLNGQVMAVGALRKLDATHGELKSMFVADDYRGQGLGRQLLAGLIERARELGLSRLSLETGASDYFEAARALYANTGFKPCAAFADLQPHSDSVFMTRAI